jgi:hypothetical protein
MGACWLGDKGTLPPKNEDVGDEGEWAECIEENDPRLGE